MPKQNISMRVKIDPNSKESPFPHFLPIEIFDNTEYDCRTPEDWIAMGMEGKKRKPVPGKALLPNGVIKDGVRQYEWTNVGMVGYDAEQKLYNVRALVNDETLAKGNKATQYLIPRIRLMFFAEDPYVFAARMKEAFEERKQTEALLRYHLYIDCMPTDGVINIDEQTLNKIVSWASGPNHLKSDSGLIPVIDKLCKEVQLD